MALRYIVGSSGSGKSDYLYRELLAQANQNPDRNFYLIVPEQFTMQTQKELVRRAEQHVIMNIDVVSFERLAFRIFEETGRTQKILEDTGIRLILRKLAQEQRENLTVFRANIGRMGYIDQMKSMLSELVQYGVTPEDLREIIGRMQKADGLKDKLQDVLVLYQSFEDYLSGHYITAEHLLDALYDTVGESDHLRQAVLAFDGFTGFTPVQMKLMGRLMETVSEIWLTVTFDLRENLLSENHVEELFYMSRRMVQGMNRSAQKTGFEIAEPVWRNSPEQTRFHENPALCCLEHNLFRRQVQPFAGDVSDCVSITVCINPREELEQAAAAILKMIQEDGQLRYGDFAIVSADVTRYDLYAERAFGRYGIPYFTDRKRSAVYHPLTELVRALLEIIETDYSRDSVLRLLHTGLTDLPEEERDLLDNYVTARGIRGHRRWNEMFRVAMRRNRRIQTLTEKEEERRKAEELLALNASRKYIAAMTEPLYQAFHGGKATVREICTCLYQILTDLQVEEKLSARQEELERQDRKEDAAIYGQIYQTFLDLLDKYVDLLGDEVLPVTEYTEILETGLTGARIGMIPPGNDCVLLGDMERTRLEGVKHLFFLGVNDGLVPKIGAGGGILSQYDREKLRETYGLVLSPTEREAVFIQRFYLYWSLTKPSRGLHLSYARTNSAGDEIRPSYLIDVFRQLYPNLQEQTVTDTHMGDLLSADSAVEQYILGLELAREGQVPEAWKVLHQWYMKEPAWKGRILPLYQARYPVQHRKNLTPETAWSVYGTGIRGSVTRLESYARCPYAHFLEYGLKLGERETAELKATDLGSLNHEILYRYSEKVTRQNSWYTILPEESEALLLESIREAELARKDTALYDSARNEYRLTMVRRTLHTVVDTIHAQVKAGILEPAWYERTFHITRRLQSTAEQLPEKARLQLYGVIDRMDLARPEGRPGEQLVRIIDYKSSERDFDLQEFYYGLQQQLIVYLAAAEELLHREYPDQKIIPAGVFYSQMDDPILEDTGQTAEEIQEEIRENLKLRGLVNRDVYSCMDHGMEEGRQTSWVIPVSLNKSGLPSKRSDRVLTSPEDFEALTAYSRSQMNRFGAEILGGHIEVSPYYMGRKTGCDYCIYSSICGFDPRQTEDCYRELEQMHDEEIWTRIREAAEDKTQAWKQSGQKSSAK
jgi:ATP-dependent helicase/nuclease subunit B